MVIVQRTNDYDHPGTARPNAGENMANILAVYGALRGKGYTFEEVKLIAEQSYFFAQYQVVADEGLSPDA